MAGIDLKRDDGRMDKESFIAYIMLRNSSNAKYKIFIFKMYNTLQQHDHDYMFSLKKYFTKLLAMYCQ